MIASEQGGMGGWARRGALWLVTVVAALAPTARGVAQTGIERPEMVTAATEKSIRKGLDYLARNQSRDGSWRSGGGGGGYPTAMTALAGLALMAGGNTPLEGKHSDTVRKAVDFLMNQARKNNNTGVIADLRIERSCMHGHGFAMLFLAQAYGMERDQKRQNQIRRVLEKAIKLTARTQSAAGGWLYQPNNRGDEGSVTVTQIQGLRACRNVGIKVSRKVIDRACEYIQRSAQPDGGIAYRVGQGGSRPPITAAAVAVMYSAGKYEHPVAKRALAYIKKLLKTNRNSLGGGHKFYAMLYASQAMYLSSEANWKMYFPSVRDDLIRSQMGNGSWNGDHVGPVYGTSIALITLQLPYANLPIFLR